MLLEEYYADIKSRFGNIKRARGTFLYTEKGVRVTDMYLEAGRAILGWGNDNGATGSGGFLVLKNLINRGLTGSFTTDFSRQLDKAVSDLLKANCKAFVFFDYDQILKAAKSLSKRIVTYIPWRGLLCEDESVSDFECVIITPPLALPKDVFILACRDDITTFFKSASVPGFLAGALARSVYDLIKELPLRQEKKWFLYDSVLNKYFTRRGCYLFPKMPEAKYDSFVAHCLDCNLAISPDYKTPSIVPYGADKGVFTLLKNNPWSE